MKLNLFTVTGNTTPRRIGVIFPTGWTRLDRADGDALIATAHRDARPVMGSTALAAGTVTVADVIRRQVRP